MKPKISKGDTVEVISGDNKGYRGEVQRVIRRKKKDGTYDSNKVYVLVAGANLVTKHQKRSGRVNTQTGRIEKEAPIHLSNVALIDSDGKPTRSGYEVAAGGDKTRIGRRSNSPLPKPTE